MHLGILTLNTCTVYIATNELEAIYDTLGYWCTLLYKVFY